MKQFLWLGTLLISLLVGRQSVAAAFVEGLEDIPLAAGLTQIEGGNLNFGNEEIRLVEVYLQSNLDDFAAIARFYRDTLPQMGWQMKNQNKTRIGFERENEILEIAEESAQPLIIRLTVKSKN